MGLITDERIKLTAAYVNTAAGGLFTVGRKPVRVDTPRRDQDFPVGEQGAARGCPQRPQGPEAVTEIQIVGFIVAPLMAVAFGWGIALWARYNPESMLLFHGNSSMLQDLVIA